jgi:hypothetical protein
MSHYKEVERTMDEFEQEQDAISITANTGNIKDRLPMLYTPRGKLKKNPEKKRVSGLNAAELMNQIDLVRNSPLQIKIVMYGYTVVMTHAMSSELRLSGLIAEIMLGGYNLVVV